MIGGHSWVRSAVSPWLEVPFVRQVKAGCGSAALAMVMQYWVSQRPELDAAAADAERIDEALPPPSAKGIPGQMLKRYLEGHGFAAFTFRGELRDLEQHLNKGRPVVVCLGLKGPREPLHYVVVVGMEERAVVLNDPARGKLVHEDLDRFLVAWKATENWALLAVPRPTSKPDR
jgi:predicted double-glycine peptidase